MAAVDWSKIIGKTIASVDESSCNVVNLTFTDNTRISVDTEAVGMGLYCPVLYVMDAFTPDPDEELVKRRKKFLAESVEASKKRCLYGTGFIPLGSRNNAKKDKKKDNPKKDTKKLDNPKKDKKPKNLKKDKK